MTVPRPDALKSPAGFRWWLVWAVIGLLVVGGVVLTLRVAPGVTPVLDSSR